MPARRSSASKAADVAITVRPSRNLLKRIDRWIASQDTPFGRSEAIRRLAEFGLKGTAASSKAGKPSRGAEKAAGMASEMIDYLEDQQQRAKIANSESEGS